ncbi:SDR family NAD(P)-dependent oxidoreductase [Caballeronia sp. LZ065]|jgi:NAD(P)-dependent dehydrogenase (short-subunit alcohol dehydrogenase family)|uniref:SDR family oxidoreductase n=1 Tax=Caballeronia sp. LZ065 TaxID=3038571 RepID=UPI00285A390C|nr:SDR family oxidoreductase [Caballeronia sp. LZ065]MDR5781210.1 SDR family NAD(P)-dependent oxidoreductase [Caballeronia sp. LZ065]
MTQQCLTRSENGLQNWVILVTGGGSGLGAALCRRLASEGATLVAADLSRKRAEDAAAGIVPTKGRCHPLELDVTDAAATESAIHSIVRQYGSLDVVINSAAIDVTEALDTLSVADWDRVLSTNLRGPYLVSRYAVPHMKAAGAGHIVNIVSTASKRAWPNAAAYHASKWGLLGLSHSMHAELRPFGIKVSAIVAGGMRTPFLLDRFPDIDPTTLQDPANVAEVIHFILTLPGETVVPEVMVLPIRETSWP